MPLTFAHPAAVVPLDRPFGRYGVLSALVIGSMTPDFPYFLPLPLTHADSHSLAGLFWFCLPIGLLSYLVFHAWLKDPLVSLLPPPISAGIDGWQRKQWHNALPSWLAVLLSLLIGAASHILWDTFTHKGAFGVTHLPLLQTYLFSIGGYPVYLYKLLQHASTLVGLTLLALWLYRWLRQTPIDQSVLWTTTFTNAPTWVFPVLLSVTLIAGMGAGVQAISAPFVFSMLPSVVKTAIQASVVTLCVSLLVYASLWHRVIARKQGNR